MPGCRGGKLLCSCACGSPEMTVAIALAVVFGKSLRDARVPLGSSVGSMGMVEEIWLEM